MASVYKKGDMIKVVATTPTGPVESIRMREDGVVLYLITYTDANSVEQQRWFPEHNVTLA
jgi:hypothetical protein